MNPKITSKTIIELLHASMHEVQQNIWVAIILMSALGVLTIGIDKLLNPNNPSSGAFLEAINGLKALPFQLAVLMVIAFLWYCVIDKNDEKHYLFYVKRAVKFVTYSIVMFIMSVAIGVAFSVVLALIALIFHPDASSGVGDVIVMALPFTLMSGFYIALPFALRFSFVFPAVAFGQETSLSIAWKQSKGWGIKLLLILIIYMVVLAIFSGIIQHIIPHSLLNYVGVAILVLLAVSYLVLVGFIAQVYLVAIKSSERQFSVTVH